MRTPLSFFGAVILLVLAGTTACGGKVVLDPGGQGGSSSDAASTTSNTSVTSTGPGPGPSDIEKNCAIVCNALRAIGCAESDCEQGCITSYTSAGSCADEFATFVACFAQQSGNLPSCDVPFACEPVEDAWHSCQSGSPCGDSDCFGGPDGSCFCTAHCSGASVEANCNIGSSGVYDCLCVVNGEAVAKCQDFAAPCDVQQGCCAPFFSGQE